MPLTRTQKQRIVAEVTEIADSSVAMLAAEYAGMTVAEMTTLRRLASESEVSVRVVKNTLAQRAVADTQFAAVAKALKGQLILAFAKAAPGDAARVFKQYAKECQNLRVQLLSLGGELLPASQLEAIAALPSRDQALAKLLATMQAPMAKLALTLNAVPSKLVRTLAAVKEAQS